VKDTENIYSLAFHHGQGAIAIMHFEDWRIVEVNDSTVRMFGYEQDELIGRIIHDLNLTVHPERIKLVNDLLKHDRFVQNVEGMFRRKNGDIFNGLLSATTFSLNGEKCILVEIIETTERIEAEKALRKSEQTLARAQRVANIGSWEWNVTDNTVIWSEQACRIYGLDPDCREVEMATFMDIAHPDDLDMIRTMIDDFLHNHVTLNFEHRVKLPDGTVRHVHQVAEFIPVKHGVPLHILGTVQDITERTVIENEQRKIETRYRDVVESANNVIARWNHAGIITYMNPYGLKFFGYSEDELFGKSMFGTIVPVVETGTERDLKELMHDILTYPDDYVENENENIRSNGDRVWMAWSNRAVLDDDQRIEILSIGADITKRKQLEEKLDRMSRTDALTGLANRREFDEILSAELNRALRSKQPLSLLMLDIDFFKRYNDTYGHQAGDSCLKDIAGVLKESTKRAGELAARYGGEEFAVILPLTSDEDAFLVADHILHAVTDLEITHEASDTAPYLTISAGITTCIPKRGVTPDDIIKQADDALYQAKENGRNGIAMNGPHSGV
jgi:diguanylate cyclase (GGDEF)-like protein/PAS domain S-box-containing protein